MRAMQSELLLQLQYLMQKITSGAQRHNKSIAMYIRSVGTVTHREHQNLGMHEWKVGQTRKHRRGFRWQWLRRTVFHCRRGHDTRVRCCRRWREGFEHGVKRWRPTPRGLCWSTVGQLQHLQQLFLRLFDCKNIHNFITLHYIIVINVFKEKTSITLQELNAVKKMSFQSTSENRQWWYKYA